MQKGLSQDGRIWLVRGRGGCRLDNKSRNRKDYSGTVIGDIKVIGDTGKNTNQTNQILLVRNLLTGELKEVSASSLKAGRITGWKGSKAHKEHNKRISDKNKEKNAERLKIYSKQNGNKYGAKNLEKSHKKVSELKTNVGYWKNSIAKLGDKNITYDKTRKKWRVQIIFRGEFIVNKRFETYEEAVFERNKTYEKIIYPYINELQK